MTVALNLSNVYSTPFQLRKIKTRSAQNVEQHKSNRTNLWGWWWVQLDEAQTMVAGTQRWDRVVPSKEGNTDKHNNQIILILSCSILLINQI